MPSAPKELDTHPPLAHIPEFVEIKENPLVSMRFLAKVIFEMDEQKMLTGK